MENTTGPTGFGPNEDFLLKRLPLKMVTKMGFKKDGILTERLSLII